MASSSGELVHGPIRLGSLRVAHFGEQFLETVEILAQALLRIDLGPMVQDAERAAISGVPDHLQHAAVFLAAAQRQDLLAADRHAVQVHAGQVGQHLLERGGKLAEVFVAVVEVVDDPHGIGVGLLSEPLGHGDHVGRFARPAAVIVEGERATETLWHPSRTGSSA